MTPTAPPSAGELVQPWAEAGLSTAPADRPRAEQAIRGLYAAAGLAEPEVIWRPDAFSGAAAVVEIAGGRPPTPLAAPIISTHSNRWPQLPRVAAVSSADGTVRDLIVNTLRPRLLIFGQPLVQRLQLNLYYQAFMGEGLVKRSRDGDLEPIRQVFDLLDRRQPSHLGWEIWSDAGIEAVRPVRSAWDRRTRHNVRLALHSCFWGSLCITVEPLLDLADVLAGQEIQRTDPWREAVRSLGLFWTLPGVCVATERPCSHRYDAQGRLHRADGMAVQYRTGWGLYRWHGRKVPGWIITDPDLITVRDIDAQPGAETRRVMLERYGQENYLVHSGGREIHRDDFGVLYRKEQPGDEPLVLVKVVNATAEPDGTFKDYFLRVPPTIRSAHEAVAWTFGKTPDAYAPHRQT